MRKEYFEIFVNKSQDYYLEYFDNYESGKKIQFNLMAFLFGLFWFLYRKMYLETIILFFLIYIESILETMIRKQLLLKNAEPTIAYQLLTIIATGLVFGFFGNWIYLKHSNRKILSLTKTYHKDEQILRDKIQKKGGISFLGIGIVLIVSIFITIIYKI